jgi:small subunit ribosomal protein S3
MGNKSNATGLRIGINQEWLSTWYVPRGNFADTLLDDIKIRDYVEKKLRNANVAKCLIKRAMNKVTVEVYVARPGVVIGRGGAGIQDLNKELKSVTRSDIEVKVFELKNPEAVAKYIGEEIAKQLASRIAPKAAALRLIEAAKGTGVAKGVSIWISGRIKGAEIARTEKFGWGTIPRHTLRANVDYNFTEIHVPGAGRHGIKTWVYRGEKSEAETSN